MIKGFKHMKMATIITLSVAVISLLCLSCLYLVMTSSVTRTSKQGSIDNMYTALDGQANMIELFVQESERSLRQYATADELKELLLEPDDAAKQQAAQAYTERFFAQLESWEGVYLSKWDTTVLAHSSPFRSGHGYAQGRHARALSGDDDFRAEWLLQRRRVRLSRFGSAHIQSAYVHN